jgi:hypothetical protein
MGRETTTRESALDRFGKMVQIGSQIAGTLDQINRTGIAQQQTSQEGDRIRIAQQNAQMQMDKFAVEREEKDLAYKKNKIELNDKVNNRVMDTLFQIASQAAEDENPNEVLEAAFRNEDKVKELAEVMGFKGEELTVNSIKTMTKNGKVAIPLIVTLKTQADNLKNLLAAPPGSYNPEEVQKAFSEYTKANTKLGTYYPASVVAPYNETGKSLEKQIADRNATLTTSLDKAKDRAFKEAKDASKPVPQTEEQKIFAREGTKALTKRVESLTSLDERAQIRANIRDILKTEGTGPIQGSPAVWFAKKLGIGADSSKSQLLEQLLTTDGIYKIVAMAKEAGARSIDSDAERKFIERAMAKLEQNPEVILDILQRQEDLDNYIRTITKEQQAWVAEGNQLAAYQAPQFNPRPARYVDAGQQGPAGGSGPVDPMTVIQNRRKKSTS